MVMQTGGGWITSCESGVVVVQHGVLPQIARGPEDLVTSAVEQPLLQDSETLVRHDVSVSTKH